MLAKHGEAKAIDGISANVKTVHLDVWRDCLKQRGMHDGGEAGKKWFQRTRGKLIAEKRIAVNHPYVWTVQDPGIHASQHPGQSGHLSRRVPGQSGHTPCRGCPVCPVPAVPVHLRRRKRGKTES
jgi:hypothetical protein